MRRIAVLALTGVLLVGCGDDDAPDSGSGPTADDTAAAVEAVEAVAEDVSSVAPALESYYRAGGGYPASLADAQDTLGPAGVALQPGHVVGGYTYEPEAEEFVLCIEDEETGAWASYDTAPMGVRDSGASGGCPV